MNDKETKNTMKGRGEVEAYEIDTRVDELLADPSQLAVAQMVSELPQEEPSLAWRSALSERIHTVAKARERKRRVALIFRPALGLSLGAAMALAFISTRMTPFEPAPARATLEEQIVTAHRDSVHAEQFWGGVRAGEEFRAASAPAVQEYQWDETDLGTL
jgi:hypothetical protein